MNSVRRDKIAVITITRKGTELGRRLVALFPGSQLYLPQKFAAAAGADEHAFPPPTRKAVEEAFAGYRYLVLIMAAGAAVRLLASQIKDKHEDPGVVVIDEAGKFAVSLLSGHAGGANELAVKIASRLGARPVITTASDVSGIIAVDLLGREMGWEIEPGSDVTGVSAALVNGEPVGVYQDAGQRSWRQKERLPVNARTFASLEALNESGCRAALIITDKELSEENRFRGPSVVYRPRNLVLGIGCNRGTDAGVIEAAVQHLFRQQVLSVRSILKIATIDVKKDEAGLLEFARKHNLPVDYHNSHSLRRAGFPSGPSAPALKHVGTPSVCEAAAILSGGTSIIMPKRSYKRMVTVAAGRVSFEEEPKRGALFVVGIGPGDPEHLTLRAREAIDRSEVITGYRTYVKLVEPLLAGKEVVATGMGDEVERARAAVSLAGEGKTVAMVCGGDAGIYGMAGLVLEIVHGDCLNLDIEVVPGVPSLAAAAACLGAPLMTDFAVISLSDYLTSWEDIRKRLELAARGDFVIVIHNPQSKKRQHQLIQARDIIMRYRAPGTPAGIVSSAYRPDQRVAITDLEHLLDYEIDMRTTIIIGNSHTFSFDVFMVTPRGYQAKYDLGAGECR